MLNADVGVFFDGIHPAHFPVVEQWGTKHSVAKQKLCSSPIAPLQNPLFATNSESIFASHAQ